jgi:hypothetical protein
VVGEKSERVLIRGHEPRTEAAGPRSFSEQPLPLRRGTNPQHFSVLGNGTTSDVYALFAQQFDYLLIGIRFFWILS